MFLPAMRVQRRKRGSRFRLFLAGAFSDAQLDSFPEHLCDKEFLMFRSRLRYDFVDRTLGRDSLQNFLELTLRIDLERLERQQLDVVLRFIQDKAANSFQITVQI